MWFGRRGSRNSEHPVIGQDSYDWRGRSSRGTLTSPATTVSSSDVVQFHVRLAIESATQYDRFRLFIVQGGTRVEIWDKHQHGGQFDVLPHPQGGPWEMYTTATSTPTGWAAITVLIGTPGTIDLTQPVQFEFDFQTVDGLYNRTEGIFIDRVMLPCAAAPAPVAAVGRTAASDANAGLSIEPPLQSNYLPGYRPPAEVIAPKKARTPPPE